MKEYLKETIIPKFVSALEIYDKEEIEDAMIAIYKDEITEYKHRAIQNVYKQFNIEMNIEVLTYIFEAL